MKDWIYGKNAVYEAVKKNDGLTKVVLSNLDIIGNIYVKLNK